MSKNKFVVQPYWTGVCCHCPNCNKAIPDGDFCKHCGAELDWGLVRRYLAISRKSCPNEDVHNWCSYYRKSCTESTDCAYVKEKGWLAQDAGHLVSVEVARDQAELIKTYRSE